MDGQKNKQIISGKTYKLVAKLQGEREYLKEKRTADSVKIVLPEFQGEIIFSELE